MLFSSSDEFGNNKGLNILDGKVKSLKSLKTNKISPNLGWSKLIYKKSDSNHLFKHLNKNLAVYFIHSYYVEIKNKRYATSTINFGKKKSQLLYSIKIYMVFSFILKKVAKMVLRLLKIL